MDKECDGYRLTECCGAKFKYGDRCSRCMEFADNQCSSCPDIDKELCPFREEEYDDQ